MNITWCATSLWSSMVTNTVTIRLAQINRNLKEIRTMKLMEGVLQHVPWPAANALHNTGILCILHIAFVQVVCVGVSECCERAFGHGLARPDEFEVLCKYPNWTRHHWYYSCQITANPWIRKTLEIFDPGARTLNNCQFWLACIICNAYLV